MGDLKVCRPVRSYPEICRIERGGLGVWNADLRPRGLSERIAKGKSEIRERIRLLSSRSAMHCGKFWLDELVRSIFLFPEDFSKAIN